MLFPSSRSKSLDKKSRREKGKSFPPFSPLLLSGLVLARILLPHLSHSVFPPDRGREMEKKSYFGFGGPFSSGEKMDGRGPAKIPDGRAIGMCPYLSALYSKYRMACTVYVL